ncbi:MAG: DUF2802 domain-containing protein [Zoogloeaceae bacterium]|nr:DUF2802 domain-containing protein [Zoogloeaceae bacterium]
MNFEDLAIGWREALLGVVVLLVVYVLLVFSRLRRLRQAAPASDHTVPVGHDAPPAESAAGPIALAPNELPFPWNEPPPPPPEPDSESARLMAAEAEIVELRKEVAVLRDELVSMRDGFSQKLERVQSTQHVAPIYGDAMQMAVAGYDAQAIAERCGVARAEAELVVALIRNQEGSAPSGGIASREEPPAPYTPAITRMRER